jgi:hypothetical protein
MRFETRERACPAILESIDYDNAGRRHSSLGCIALADFERR